MVVTSARYHDEPECNEEILEDIRHRRDGWGRPLEFETEQLGGGIIKVTVISHGPDAKRNYVKDVYEATGEKGDDIIGDFYLQPRKDATSASKKGGELKGTGVGREAELL